MLSAIRYIFLLIVSININAQDCSINDFCENALPLIGFGCNDGATSQGEPDFWMPDAGQQENDCELQGYVSPCFTLDDECLAWNSNQNAVWYTFEITNDTPQPFSLEVLDIECTDGNELLQLGIWSNSATCNLSQETLFACASVDGNYTFENLDLPIGNYYLFVDGNNGANCTWKFQSEELIPPIDCPDVVLAPGNTICSEVGSVDLNDYFESLDNTIVGVWEAVELQANSNISSNLSASIFDVSNLETDIYAFDFVVINAIPACSSADSSRFRLELNIVESYELDEEIQICAGEEITINGFTFNENSVNTETLKLTSSNGCDSTLNYSPVLVNFKESYYEVLACEDIGTEFGGEIYFAGDNPAPIQLLAESGLCDSIVNVEVHAYPFPDLNLQDEYAITSGVDVLIDTGVTDSSSVVLVQWTPTYGLSCANCLYPKASPNIDTEYILLIHTEDGCTKRDTTNVIISPSLTPIIPTAFSPNKDGFNDEWKILFDGAYKSYSLVVYDRWGKQVFESFSPDEAWDGLEEFGSNPAIGVYMYNLIIELEDIAIPFEDKGTVTLIR